MAAKNPPATRARAKPEAKPAIDAAQLPAAAASQYYSYDEIMEIDAVYRIIIGMRANGKTYGWCEICLKAYFDIGLPSAYVRRLDEMIKPKIIAGLFDPHIDYIIEKTDGEYNGIMYRGNAWYLIRREKNKQGAMEIVARDPQPFCRSYAISTAETTKGVDYGDVYSVCFDEFMTRAYYLQNEFILFQNLLSSIIRDRPHVNIFMLANTVTKYCPYFKDMGLYRITKQEQGTIDVYTVGKDGTKIAVEYCAGVEAVSKKVSKFFCFDNPQISMITTGGWEMALYRHAPENLSQYRIMISFFVQHADNVLQGDVHLYKGFPIIFFHAKTSEIKDPDKSIIYQEDTTDGNPLHQKEVKTGFCRAQKIIFDLIRTQKTFYADNEIGEAVAAWLKPQRLAAR